MNIDEMKKEIYALGDYTKAEVENMAVFEIINAWMALPAVVL